MAKDLGSFPRRIASLAALVEENVSRGVRRVALATDQVLVLSTPVDTGRARSNWLANVGSPLSGTVEPDASPQESIARAARAIAAFKAGLGASIFITNNLDYIVPLNEGSSAQAPAGFVEAAVSAGATAAKGIRLTKKGG